MLNHFYSFMVKGLVAKKSDDFSAWYADVVLKAELIEHTSVSGCMVYRPGSFAIWEALQRFLDSEFKKLGVQNAYFPSLIPESLLTKEADHVEGFAPEVAWVTHGGDKELSERLAIRPTSETIMYESYGKWIRSYRDLPLKLNQWCNVVRWEFKHPRPFLRGREFLWQEGHTVHASEESARQEVYAILDVYRRAYEEILAVPVLAGAKSIAERFAGADTTTSLEALFPDGKAVQACTSHYLGTGFAQAFNITFLDASGQQQFGHQNSWGFSTRSIGIMIGVHGDDKGLVLPPRIAPVPVVVVPITFSKDKEGSQNVLSVAQDLCDTHGWHLDNRDQSPGSRFAEWEMKGIPVRIELGPRDLQNNTVVVVRRDTSEKAVVSLNEVAQHVSVLLEDIQKSLFVQAKKHLDASIVEVSSLSELKDVVEQGKIGVACWVDSPENEEEIKKVTGAKSLTSASEKEGMCVVSGKKVSSRHYFGKSY